MANGEAKRRFDLEERTAKFGEAVILYARSLARDGITDVLICQLVRSATSIGANYCEADDSGSKERIQVSN